MIQMGTAMSIVPCLSTAVIPGIVKVPLLDFPPVTVEIAAMRHAPRLEVQSFIEIAKQKYRPSPRPAADGGADLRRSCDCSKVPYDP